EEAGGGVPQKKSEVNLGGLGGFDVRAFGEGPIVRGAGGVGSGEGTGVEAGSGGAKSGFGGRGSGHREEMLGAFGGTKQSERAVAAGLNWLARHQNANGSWSLDYRYRCKDGSCKGVGSVASDAGATGMALLPFLAAGQTQNTNGPYKNTIHKGLAWLLKYQAKNGDLSAGCQSTMYSHGIAAIALCETYGMTKDARFGRAAQSAINFIEAAQHPESGGWRYVPGDVGDTSVLGWQMMALKSGQMAGLRVNYQAFAGAEKWLQSVAGGDHGGLFSYVPQRVPSPAMTAVGLLCHQYLRMRPDTPAMIEGTQYLMENQPTQDDRNFYYWYYATQVMHNMPGPDWDTWNRAMRRLLITSQATTGCATGSWDPDEPNPDAWGPQGGRLMLTSFATLTLEIYYRYLPLFQLDQPGKPARDPAPSSKEPPSPKREAPNRPGGPA
ncbi:MAG: terpene cyclase/mutase family protein, partial [Planctomycetia bacterium]|nr:terpene cyclase/mutase family protein [Planctomycetia bacterium]